MIPDKHERANQQGDAVILVGVKEHFSVTAKPDTGKVLQLPGIKCQNIHKQRKKN